MAQGNQSINSHVEKYLDYYCGLSHAPGFAVLLKGQWGSGKTWFINKYSEKLKENNQKCLYVSLYGVTTVSDIEDEFFQQLHPILSSKGMAITGKILKGLLKGTLKIDLNADSNDDGALSVEIPEINLPEYLKNTDKSVLIFDDLERCKIDLSSILGYINYFVEHQELKVIIVANEDELLKNDSYQFIKEKLIGKTFGISPDFEGALENFIIMINDLCIRQFLSDNTELIQDMYDKAEYENLRNLKQIVLDFERIFETLPEKAKNKSELLQDLLKLLMAFSIEIKRGKMLPKDISKLQEEYISGLGKQISSRQVLNSVAEESSEEQTSLQKILNRYIVLNLYDPFPSTVWWQMFLDKGIIDIQELKQSISNSRYFQDKNTPNWVKLWHFSYLSDTDFDNLLKEVELEYSNRQFLELGVIKHVFGLFLIFSDAELYCKNKEEILKDSKLYIEYLKNNNRLDLSLSTVEDTFGGYNSLGFQGKEFNEFKEFFSYINKVQELARAERMPDAAQELLVTMQSDIWRFHSMICLFDSQNRDVPDQRYYEDPILKYIEPTAFIESLLLMNFEDQRHVFWTLTERYKFSNINEKLLEELEWLESIQSLLLQEAGYRKGKVSGYRLELLKKHYLNQVIEKLEARSSQVQINEC